MRTTPNSPSPARQSAIRARYRSSNTCSGSEACGKSTVDSGNIPSVRATTGPRQDLTSATPERVRRRRARRPPMNRATMATTAARVMSSPTLSDPVLP